MMFPAELECLAKRRYGNDWEKALSAATGVNIRTVHRWWKAEARITPPIEQLIRRICEEGAKG